MTEGAGRQMVEGRRVPLRRLLAMARPEALRLTVATAALLAASGMTLAWPQVVRWLVDEVVERGDLVGLDTAAMVLVALFVAQSVLVALRAWLFTVAGERVVARLRQRLFDAILGQDVAFFDASRTGELTNRLASDTTVLQNAVTVNLSMALRYAVGAVGGVVLLIVMSPPLALLALLVVPVVAVGSALYGRVLRRLSRDFQDALARSTQVAEEALSGLRTVRSFAREPQESARYHAAVEASYRIAARRALAVGAFHGIGGLAGYLAIALVVWQGGHMVLGDQMTMGDLTAFLLYTFLVAVSLGTLSTLWGDFMRAAGASERVFALLDARGALESGGGQSPGPVRGEVRFEGVSFAYPTRPDVPVLAGLDLHLGAGEVVALVGPSGAGKSTVAALLLRFYDPDAGRVTLDGRDLRELAPQPLRERVGIVSQEPVLFAASIAENIRYGRPDATDAEVEQAARAANAHDFVAAFPEGFHTEVGERGVQLSGGQKQRVAIARALLKDPPLLVLDEATSALDAESEHLVQEALDRLMRGRTTLVIAHRLSTVQGADRVVVLQGGAVAEQGTHAELLSMGGLYHRLVQRQFAEPAAMEG